MLRVLLLLLVVVTIDATNQTFLNQKSILSTIWNELNGQSINTSSSRSWYKRPRHLRYDYYDDLFAPKSDMMWLLPLAFLVGSGILFLPLIGLLCSMLFTTGTINLTAGRKKRSFQSFLDSFGHKPTAQILDEIARQLQQALNKFGKI